MSSGNHPQRPPGKTDPRSKHPKPPFAPQSQLYQIRGDAFATLAYVANWRFAEAEDALLSRFSKARASA